MREVVSRRAEFLSRGVETVSVWVGGGFLVVNVVVVLFGVVMRYGFNAQPIWTAELARYTLIWGVLLAGAAALRRGEHMQVEIILNRLPRPFALVADGLRRIAILVVLVFMTVMGVLYAVKVAHMSTLSMNISRAFPLASIPAGMGLILLQFMLMQIVRICTPEKSVDSSVE